MDPHVIIRLEGRLGRITLNRPQALNALSLPMIRTITAALHQWESSGTAHAVLLEGTGDRAFCAGGDIQVVYRSIDPVHPKLKDAEQLWREQHLLDALIADYTLPVVTVLDGLVLGGGVGIGCHARHRLVTPATALGMPEVAIGLAPDVGALHVAARAPGYLGDHLALTATTAGPRTALRAGYADTAIDPESLPPFVAELAAGVSAAEAVATLQDTELPEDELVADQGWIEECYGAADLAGDDGAGLLARLAERREPEARKAAQTISQMSPVAVAVTLRALRRIRAKGTDLFTVFRDDLRRNVHFSGEPDLREGIRAAIVDKDRAPRWSVPSLADVEPAGLKRFFEPFDGPDLEIAEILERPKRQHGLAADQV